MLSAKWQPFCIGLSVLKGSITKLEFVFLLFYQLRRESSEQKSTLEKSLLDKEAQIAAAQTAREELEKQLKSYQIRARIERETTDKMHMETIKVCGHLTHLGLMLFSYDWCY